MANVRYVFHSTWHVGLPPGAAYRILADPETYAAWWPEIRHAERVDEGRVAMVARSLLPYELRFVTEAAVTDPAAGVIEGRLSGDLEGFSRWTILPDGAGSRLEYHQEVVTTRRLLNALAPVARPLFRLNHWVMMRRGQAGLAVFAAGYRLAGQAGGDDLS